MSENNNELDEVFGEFSSPTRRRRRSRATSTDVPEEKPIEIEAPEAVVEHIEDEPENATMPAADAPEQGIEPAVDVPEEIEEPTTDAPEAIEPEAVEPEVVEEPRVQRRRRRRGSSDETVAKTELVEDEEEVEEVPATEAPTGRRFSFGKKPTEEAPITAAPVDDASRPAGGGWGARFGSGTSGATSAPATSSGTSSGWAGRFGSSGGARPAATTRPSTSGSATTTRSSTSTRRKTGFPAFVQGLLGFVTTAAVVLAFVISMLSFFFDFVEVGQMIDGYIDFKSLNLLEYLVFSEYALVPVFFASFASIGEMAGVFVYVLLIGIPSILFTVNYAKRLISGIKAVFTGNRRALVSNLISGLQSCFTLLVMHAIAGSSSHAIDPNWAGPYIQYRIGDGFISGLALSAFMLIVVYIISFFMDDRNYLNVKVEIVSVARTVTYAIMLATTLAFNGTNLLVMVAYSLEDMNLFFVAASIAIFVVFIRIYKRANRGFAVNLACLLGVGYDFGDKTASDASPKTAYMKPTFIDAAIGLGATIFIAVTELYEGTTFISDFMFIILAIAGVCAIVHKIVKP